MFGLGIFAACLLGLLVNAEAAGTLTRRFAWKSLDYALSPKDRMVATLTGKYIPENNIPVGIEVVGDRMFIGVPRWASGVPSTLNWVPLSHDVGESPPLIPYPDLEYNQEGNCAGLTTTYRMRADECGRLWVLDSGTLGIGNTTQQLCPYSLHAFDLKTDKQILRYQFKESDINKDTFIANIAIDVGKDCSETWVYASDELGYGLLVYSLQEHDSWRFEHGFFRPDPLLGDFNIAGLNFQWDAEGIFGMALSPKSHKQRYLLFHPLASHREFAVPLNIIRNKNAVDKSYQDFLIVGKRGDNAHSTAETLTEDGILVYTLVDQNAVGCWNSELPYNKDTQAVIAKDDVELVFPSDVRVKDGILWVISDRMPVQLEASLDFNDINFRVFFAPLKELIAGTVCDKHLQQAAYPQKAVYSELASYPQKASYPELASYPQKAAYSQLAAYPKKPSYSQLAAYPKKPAYSQLDTYSQKAVYPQKAAYSQQAAYSHQAVYPEQVDYSYRPNLKPISDPYDFDF